VPDSTTIRYSTNGGIATVVLNRPEVANALNETMLAELEQAMEAAKRDDHVRVVLIKGAGRSFCGGYDLNNEPFVGKARPSVYETRQWIHGSVSRWFSILWNHPKPVVAQVHGYCAAGGVEIAVMSDLCVVADDAMLGCPPTRVHGPEAVSLFPMLAGLKKAKELMLTGDYISGKQAVELGLANYSVPHEDLEGRALALAERVAKLPNEINMLNKAAVNKGFEVMGFRAAMEWASELNTLGWLTEAAVDWNQSLIDHGVRDAVRRRDDPFTSDPRW
jgi:enoyl-CoA hydratase